MADAPRSLWPAEINPGVLSPKVILHHQAIALRDQTKGLLLGELEEGSTEDGKAVISLSIYAPALDYRYRVLAASHSRDHVYPARLDAEIFRPTFISQITAFSELSRDPARRPENVADDDEEFIELVAKVLRSPRVVSIAQSLIARSNEAGPPADYVRYLKSLLDDERDEAIAVRIDGTLYRILDSGAVSGQTAMTNAHGWGISGSEIKSVDFTDRECVVRLYFSARGQHDREKPFNGDRVVGTAEAVIDSSGGVEYREVTAELDLGQLNSDSASPQEQ
jgi:hypothetical protein